MLDLEEIRDRGADFLWERNIVSACQIPATMIAGNARGWIANALRVADYVRGEAMMTVSRSACDRENNPGTSFGWARIQWL